MNVVKKHRIMEDNLSMIFLDTIVTPELDRTLSTTLYMKLTYTDQYLHWVIHHNLSAKYSVFNTLTHIMPKN